MESAMILVFFFSIWFSFNRSYVLCVGLFFDQTEIATCKKTTDNELDVFKPYAYIYT